MRRSGSSSCLLIPKGSPEAKQQSPNSGPPSVTLLHTKQLPSYSSERFFLLSELEMHAHSTLFLCDLDNEDETHETEEMSTDSANGEAVGNQQHADFPSFVLLYLLWRPDMTSNAKTFTETTVLETLKRVESLVEIINSTDPPPTSIRGSSLVGHFNAQSGNSSAAVAIDGVNNSNNNNNRGKCSVYLVVDRVSPPDKQAWWPMDTAKAVAAQERFHHVQQELAEELARTVAAHPALRQLCEGITVGVSNHERAAPGLEECVKAINLGARDRRKHHQSHPELESASKSSLGVLTEQPSDCLGLQSGLVTDAAQGVLQTCICAEWSGQGNLQTFAARGHAGWRIQHGLLPKPDVIGPRRRRIPRRRMPARSRRSKFDEEDMDRAMKEMLVDTLAAILLAFYVTFHYREEMKELFWVLNPKHWDDLIHKLREL